MRLQKKQRPLTAQVTFAVILMAVLSLVLVAAFSVYAVLQVDGTALERERFFVRSGLTEQIEGLSREQRSVTLWNDSVLNAKAGNQDWMRQNISVWMSSYYGHDRVYVLDERDRPVHAMQDGAVVEASTFDAAASGIAPLVRRLRDQMRSTAPAEAGLVDVALLGGTPAIVGVQPIVPDNDRVSQEAGTEYVHVSVQLIDADLIGRIAEHYQLENAAYVAAEPGTQAAVPLADTQGKPIGYLTWRPDRPGLALMRQAAPALIIAALLALAMLGFLLRRLRRASRQLQTSENDAQYLAFHDTLTELPNRALFEDRLDRALATVRRGRGRMALLCIDIDRFKHVNDTLGHPAGDLLVKQVATRLGEGVRQVDTVARVGGDEFAIVLVDIRNVRTAEAVAERILADLREPFNLSGDQVFVSASIGIALSPENGTEARELLRKADIALYEAKRGGRDRFAVFAGDMDDILMHKRRIEQDLRLVLDADRPIGLTYQPVFAIDGRTLLGAEAILAWEQSNLPTSQLLAIAAERGMTGLVTTKMLKAACDLARESEVPWIAVTLPLAFLRQESAADMVLSTLADAGVSASRLQVDIGENVLVDGNANVQTALQLLRDAGICVALDDFGTGPSSLTMLRRRAVDKLKIDRSFVALLGGPDPAAAIVKAVAELATAFGMRVAAEGVETEQQRAKLAALGCHEMQGPLLSPRLSALQLVELTRPGRAAEVRDAG